VTRPRGTKRQVGLGGGGTRRDRETGTAKKKGEKEKEKKRKRKGLCVKTLKGPVQKDEERYKGGARATPVPEIIYLTEEKRGNNGKETPGRRDGGNTLEDRDS